MKALTPKQERFCQAYLETGNASEAYRQVYDAERASVPTVNREAKRLLDNPKIATRLKKMNGRLLEQHDISIQRILDVLATVAFFDPRGLVDSKGRPLPLHEMPKDVRTCISLIRYGKDGAFMVRFVDRLRALELLGRYHHMWTEGAGVMPPASDGYKQFNFIGTTPEEATQMYQAMIQHGQEPLALRLAHAAKPVKGQRVR